MSAPTASFASARALRLALTPTEGLGASDTDPEVLLDRLVVRLEYRLE